MSRDEIDEAVRRRQEANPPPALSDSQLVKLRHLFDIDQPARPAVRSAA